MPRRASARATPAGPPAGAPAAALEGAGARPPGPTRHEQALLGFAAVALVMAHRYQPLFLFFPVHAFHLGLIFLAAGHLAAPAGERSLPARLGAEARSWLGLFAGASLAAAALTLLLSRAGLATGGAVPSFASADAALASLRDLALSPFGAGARYELLQPGWILVQLFLVSALFQVVAPARSRLAPGAAALLSALAALALLGDGAAGGLQLVAGRTAFALAFFLGGHLLKTAPEAARRRLLSPAAMVACFLAADALGAASGGLGYHLEQGSLGARSPPAALAATAAIALLAWQLAWQAARIATDRSALLAIGRSWRAVLVGQSAAFFATNCALLLLGHVAPAQLSVAFSWNLNQTWLFYLAPALALPVLARSAAARLRKRQVPA